MTKAKSNDGSMSGIKWRRGRKESWYVAIIGANAYKMLKDILTPEKPKDKTYAELREALLIHYSPKPLIIAERFKFYKRGQKDGAYVADYVITLKRLSATCDFGVFLKQALRDRLVCGLRDENIQRILLTMKKLKRFKLPVKQPLLWRWPVKVNWHFAPLPLEPLPSPVTRCTGSPRRSKVEGRDLQDGEKRIL